VNISVRISVFFRTLVLAAISTVVPGLVCAQGSVVGIGIPEHATARAYRGYRESGELCVAINAPSNGYLTNSAYGSGWACDRGYRAEAADCVAVVVPVNAYYVDASFGSGWKCDRGYADVGKACVPVQLPDNAHLDYSGSGWDCDRPFRRERDRCASP
jgi:hypothetical protein